ncbi:hypothetical protein MTR67_031806 [Solanum verrucosum]|uniref:Uncharacterized protein n=1 Tax=Solanum verrucosum TaxID=315347 RepID=A0AAF0U374_SOLVR|nr:hypothetical protein MTR67_031806 [Solanum verrucosum]
MGESYRPQALVFRDALDSMTEDQFIWEPYFVDIIENLLDYCRVGKDI